MKIYFEEFHEGREVSYLTPGKIYEVVGRSGGGDWAKIKDDQGDQIMVKISSPDQTYAPWKILLEETKPQSAADIVASLESERNALANSIDSVNELLDSLSVPKAETLSERIKLAVSKEHFAVGYPEDRREVMYKFKVFFL